MSNWLAVSVTVIHLSSWTRLLTCSELSAIHGVVRQPEQSSSRHLFCHFGTFPTVGTPSFAEYSFLCILWISKGFTTSDHKKQAVLAYLHYNCMSFTECNSYPIICLDFTRYEQYMWCLQQWDLTNYHNFTWKLPLLFEFPLHVLYVMFVSGKCK